MKACGYKDRDGELCKTRIHNLTSTHRPYVDSKQNTTGTLDAILSDKPTAKPHFLASSSE